MSKVKKGMKGIGILAIVGIIVLGILGVGGVGYNVDEEFTVIQYPNGTLKVKDTAGVYFRCFGKVDAYPDVDIIYYSKDITEGSDEDESIETLFKDKGKAWFNFQVTVRNPKTQSDQIDFHRLCKGDYDNLRNAINARLKNASRQVTEKLTASQVAESQSAFVRDVEQIVKDDTMLIEEFKVKVNDIQLTGIKFDANTETLFATQQQSLLLKKQAEVDGEKFKQQTLATQFEFEQKIAQQKGEADVVAQKARTDAEREKEIAEIEAERKVTVAEFARQQAEITKQQAEVVANQKLAVAEIAKLESIELAEAKIIQAKAREQEITLSGAMTETQKLTLQIECDRDIRVAEHLSKMAVPKVVMSGGAGGEGQATGNTQFDNLLALKMLEAVGIGLVD